jgi:uncharacterized protein YndB with AHSA1/START domain
MKTVHFEILIRSPRQQVWEKMLAPDSYPQWTEPFGEGSYYEGSWEKGAKIRFLSPSGEGMSSVIAENRKPEFLSIKHLGIVKNGVEDTESPQARDWASAYENYTLSEQAGATAVKVDLDTSEEFEKMFAEMWPKALGRLKQICEG